MCFFMAYKELDKKLKNIKKLDREIQDFFEVGDRTLFRLKRKALQEIAKQI